MASLGDFFAKKKKKVIKSTNLNHSAATAAAVEEPKKKDKKDDEDGWQEEQIVAATMKVEVAGKLKHDDEKKDADDEKKDAWGSCKPKEVSMSDNKKYPSLSKAMQHGGMCVQDNTSGKIVVDHSKNAFASLRGDDDDDDEVAKKKKVVGIAGKKQGESLIKGSEAGVANNDRKAPAKKTAEEDSDEDTKKPTKKVVKKHVEDSKPTASAMDDKPDDCKVVKDVEASKRKYKGRRKLEKVELPDEELEEEKENLPSKNVTAKKKKVFVEEDAKPKLLQYAPDM